MADTSSDGARNSISIVAAIAAAAVTILVLDIAWLGVVAQDLYDSMLGSLKRPQVYWPAAVIFYAMYVGAVVYYAVIGASDTRAALQRGAALGFVTYATYELTNWAVLEGWPALLVPIDVAWGVILTAVVALSGKVAHAHVLR